MKQEVFLEHTKIDTEDGDDKSFEIPYRPTKLKYGAILNPEI
jgi:hypothetical protein